MQLSDCVLMLNFGAKTGGGDPEMAHTLREA